LFLLDSMKELATLFESGKYTSENYNDLKSFRKKIKIKNEHYKKQINNTLANLLVLVDLQHQS